MFGICLLRTHTKLYLLIYIYIHIKLANTTSPNIKSINVAKFFKRFERVRDSHELYFNKYFYNFHLIKMQKIWKKEKKNNKMIFLKLQIVFHV